MTVSARSIGRRREEAGDDSVDCPLLPAGMPAILVVLILRADGGEGGEIPGPRASSRNHEGMLPTFLPG